VLEYIVIFYTNVVATFLTVLKILFAKFFAYFAMFIIALVIFFTEVAWEAAKEFIALSEMDQYILEMYSYLPTDVSAFFFDLGFFDFLSFILVALIARAISSYIPFSKF
jgi:hypothetical protein